MIQPQKVDISIKAPVLIDRQVKLVVNKRERDYHSLPKNERSYKVSISSEIRTHQGIATTDCIRGLTREQEMIFLPRLISKTPDDIGWQLAVDNYWRDFSFKIDGELTLNASCYIKTAKIGEETVEVEEPVVLDDYIKYGMAMQSSKVAKTDMDKANADMYEVFLEDLSIEKKAKLDKFELSEKADINYASLLNSSNDTTIVEKVDWLLDKLKENSQNFASSSYKEKLMALKEIVTANPESFNKEFDNKDLKFEAFVYRLIQNKIITLEGSLHFFGDENMGNFRETVEYVKDQTKTATVLKMREQLKVASLKKI